MLRHFSKPLKRMFLVIVVNISKYTELKLLLSEKGKTQKYYLRGIRRWGGKTNISY